METEPAPYSYVGTPSQNFNNTAHSHPCPSKSKNYSIGNPPQPMADRNSTVKANCAKGDRTLKVPNHTRNHIPKRKGRKSNKQEITALLRARKVKTIRNILITVKKIRKREEKTKTIWRNKNQI